MSTINPFATHIESFGPGSAIVHPQAEPTQPLEQTLAAEKPEVAAPAPIALPSGAFIQVRQSGSDTKRPHFTVHLVEFWASESDFKDGKPCAVREDFPTQWDSPSDYPAARMIRIFDIFWRKRLADGRRGDFVIRGRIVISDAPDKHGNLSHPSMAALKAVPA